MSASRQLAAIMFTDIVGFTALMGSDEEKTMEILDKNRNIHKPIITEYGGQWIKELGDGVMATFDTASNAVRAAVKIMETCHAADQYKLSIGIHSAEVIFKNEDVFGDGVNIAARVQGAAPSGCILVTDSIRSSISNKRDIQIHYFKETTLKNVSKAITLYQVLYAGSEIVKAEAVSASSMEKSIAVLPFVNMSSDPEQEYFSDGISEEIINMLAQVEELKVIGRTSSFAFKGQNMDLKVIGEQLDVTHILEGSVRKGGNKLRITAQLIDVSNGFHLYSEKFDRELEDIFAIQDEISEAILNAVKIRLFGEEKEALSHPYSDNIEAYDLYLKGRYHMHKFTPDGLFRAIDYYDAAIALEPNFAISYAGLTMCYSSLKDFNWTTDKEAIPKAKKAANKSLELDDTISESHMAVGRILLHQEWRIQDALVQYRKALSINPNSADCHSQIGMCLVLLGHTEEALVHAETAIRLDPFSILNLWISTPTYSCAGDHETTITNGRRILELDPNMPTGHMWIGLGHVGLKEYDRAIPALQTMVRLNPGPYSLSLLGSAYGLMGEKKKAEEIIEKIEGYEVVKTAGNFFVGNVYASIGKDDTAFRYFERAVENREGHVLWIQFYVLRYSPELFKDPRTKKLFDKIGLPHIEW